MKNLQILLILSLAVGSLCTTGIDVANAITTSAFTCAKNAGYSFAIVRAWRSYGAFDPNVVANLKNAKSAGLTTDIYMFPCRGKSATTQVDETIAGVPGDLYTHVWVDV